VVTLDAYDGAVVRYADEKITTIGVQKGGDRLEGGMRHALVIFAIFLEIPPERGFELKSL